MASRCTFPDFSLWLFSIPFPVITIPFPKFPPALPGINLFCPLD